MQFNHQDFNKLATLFHGHGVDGYLGNPAFPGEPYKGYRPTVRERPNDDPTTEQTYRFLHINLKYSPPDWAIDYLYRAHGHACRVALALGVPPLYMPSIENGTLRVIEYDAGASFPEHKDFDLFTCVMWRSHPEGLKRRFPDPALDRTAAEKLSPGLHIGELGELCGLGPATPHHVPATPHAQKAIVYFASPAMSAPLPKPVRFLPETNQEGGRPAFVADTCGQWQLERVARARY